MKIEKELKVMLSAEEHKIINQLFQWDELVLNINHYYDTLKYELSSTNTTVRIRESNKNLMLQVKLPAGDYDVIHIKKEFQKQVYNIPAKILSEELFQLVNLVLPSVIYLGSLQTERKIFYEGDNVVCLDRSTYLGIVDYELEIEYETKISDNLLAKLESIGIKICPQKAKGKYSRFIKAFERTNSNLT